MFFWNIGNYFPDYAKSQGSIKATVYCILQNMQAYTVPSVLIIDDCDTQYLSGKKEFRKNVFWRFSCKYLDLSAIKSVVRDKIT